MNATAKTARPLAAKSLNEKEFASKYNKQVRKGKTAKDHASGAWASRFGNRDARVAWQKDGQARNETFPGK